MRFVKSFFFFFVLGASLLFLDCSIAANVGFVPSTGLWFSSTSLTPGQTIRVYTVVINNDYYALDGALSFYDNNKAFDTVVINHLAQDQSQLVKVYWTPTEGAHTLSARFTKAVAVDAKGNRTDINLNTINSATGAPLSVGEGTVLPAASAPTSVSGAETHELGAVMVTVEKEGKNLVLQAPAATQEQVAGEKISATTTSAQTSAEPANTSAQSNADKASDDPFAKNREILSKASDIATTITSTAGKINEAYTAGKKAVDQGESIYNKAKDTWSQVSPYLEKAEPYWNEISNNNEPKRVAIIVGGAVVVYWILKFMIRRRRRMEWEG